MSLPILLSWQGGWLQYRPAGEDLACKVCGYSTGQLGRVWPVRCVVTEGSHLTKHITGSWDQGIVS